MAISDIFENSESPCVDCICEEGATYKYLDLSTYGVQKEYISDCVKHQSKKELWPKTLLSALQLVPTCCCDVKGQSHQSVCE